MATDADERVENALARSAAQDMDWLVGFVQGIVREERALALEQVADASYSGKHPPRVTRMLYRSAQAVRNGDA